MNNFNVQQPGMPGRGPMTFPQPPNANAFVRFIHSRLAEQGQPQGWQTQIARQSRAGTIFGIFTQLRLQSNAAQNSDQERLRYAINFEHQVYQTSQSAEQYNGSIQEKMKNLTAMRQNQANFGLQSNMPASMSNNPMMANRPANTPHMSAPTPMPPNAPGMLNANGAQNNNMGMFMRPPGPLNHKGQLNPPTAQMLPQNNPTSNPNRSQQAVPNPGEVEQLARQMRAEIEQKGNVQQVREALRQKVDPAVLQAIDSRGQDILVTWSQTFAQGQIARKYGLSSQQDSTQGLQGAPGNQTQNQTGMPGGVTRGQAGESGKPAIDFAQVLGQQAAAARSQASGETVVPATNNQNFQGPLGRGPFPNNFGGMNGNNAAISGQVPGTMAGSRPASSFQAGQIPGTAMPQPQPNFNTSASPARNQFVTGPPNALTGQPGGLHMPGPSPAMPTLNQPMGAPGNPMAPRPNQPMPRNQQPSPRPGGQPNQPPNVMQAPGLGNMPNLNTAMGKQWVQQQMQRLPAEQHQQFLHFIRAAMQQQAGSQQQQPNQTVNPQMNVAQPLPLGLQGPGVGPQGMPPNMQAPRAPNMLQQPANAMPNNGMLQPPRSANGMPNADLPNAEILMNKMPLPRDALNKRVPELDIPMGVTTWEGLFEFLSRNPTMLSETAQGHLKTIRGQQFIIQTNAQRRPPGPGAFTNEAPFVNIPQDKQTLVPEMMLLIRNNVIEANPAPQVRIKDVSPNELQNFRQRNSTGEVGRQSDMHVRSLIIRTKAEEIAKRFGQDFAKLVYLTFSRANSLALVQNNQPQQRPAPAPAAFSQGFVPNPPDQQPQQRPPHVAVAPQQRPPLQSVPNGVQTLPNGIAQPGGMKAGQLSSMNREDQLRVQEEMKKRALQATQAQNAPPSQNQEPKVEWNNMSIDQKQQRFVNLTREIHMKTPRGQPMPLPQGPQGNNMFSAVRQMIEMQQTNVAALKAFYMTTGNEKATREILAAICVLKNQVKPGNPPGNGQVQLEITASPLALTDSMNKIARFRRFVQEFQNKKGASSGPASSQAPSQPAAPATQPAAARPPAQTNNKAAGAIKNQSPSTTSAPPGQQPARPQPDGGVKYFNHQKQEFNLAIPPNKLKQKMQAQQGAPATAQVKSEQEQKQSVTPTPAPVTADLPFKCSVPGCEHEAIGFANQQEQQEHERGAHKYNGDPLRWCLGSLRESLGLNKPAALRRAAAARAPPSEASLKPTVPQAVAMKRENSTRPVTPQGRPASLVNGNEPRPSSATGSKRGSGSIQGQTEVEMGSPSKRPKTASPPVDTWQHTDWSRELMEEVWSDIPGATAADPWEGCSIPGFEMVQDSPPEIDDIKPMSDEEHIQSLLDWKDPNTEAIFKKIQEEKGGSMASPLDGGDWFMVNGDFAPNHDLDVTEEEVDEFLRNQSAKNEANLGMEQDTGEMSFAADADTDALFDM